MTDHRTTEQIIDAIDHCLDDFTVSGDAMRYVPEPPLADWERALTAHPFDPDHPALRGFSMQETRRGQVVWELYPDEPSDAAEPESLPLHRRHVHRGIDGQVVELPEAVSIGFDVGRGVHVVPVFGRGWGRQAMLDRLRQDRGDELAREQARELAEAFGVAVRPFIEWAERCAADMGMALADWQRHVLTMVAAAMPDLTGLSIHHQDDGENPRERALRLRRQRNTGPSTDRTRQRRPRTHQ